MDPSSTTSIIWAFFSNTMQKSFLIEVNFLFAILNYWDCVVNYQIIFNIFSVALIAATVWSLSKPLVLNSLHILVTCFLSGLRKIETVFDGKNQEAWRPKVVYHYIQWENIQPDFVVDITGFLEKKIACILAYNSQFYSEKSEEPITPIATKNFLESIHYRSQDFGRLVGVEYAEGFTVERYVAVNSLGDLI